jgi:hypothetical protein
MTENSIKITVSLPAADLQRIAIMGDTLGIPCHAMVSVCALAGMEAMLEPVLARSDHFTIDLSTWKLSEPVAEVLAEYNRSELIRRHGPIPKAGCCSADLQDAGAAART